MFSPLTGSCRRERGAARRPSRAVAGVRRANSAPDVRLYGTLPYRAIDGEFSCGTVWPCVACIVIHVGSGIYYSEEQSVSLQSNNDVSDLTNICNRTASCDPYANLHRVISPGIV